MTGRICKVDGCTDPVAGRDMCRIHYARDYYHRRPAQECEIEGCERPTKASICSTHRARIKKHGSPDLPGRPRRAKTETHAWCVRGEHMAPHDAFSGKTVDCREHAAPRDWKAKGPTCEDCGSPMVNRSTSTKCRQCRRVNPEPLPSGPGWIMNRGGYVILTDKKGHPNSDRQGRIAEHTFVMSQMLGRPLVKGENVHHKNGVRDDNRPKNLELWVVNQPAGQRASDLVEWALEILERYGNAQDAA